MSAEYIVVSGDTVEKLSNTIEEKIIEGYALQGGVSNSINGVYIQAMTKTNVTKI